MTKYMESRFSVLCGGDESYRNNWDAIFKPKTEPVLLRTGDRRPTDLRVDGRSVAEWYEGVCRSQADDPEPSDIRIHVEEFHAAMRQFVGTKPVVPHPDQVRLRLRLIAEEFFELLVACKEDHFGIQSAIDEVRVCIEEGICDVDIVEVADALADLDYVIEGMRLAFGINGLPIANEVHRSNMTKLDDFGNPVFRADGKLMKGPNFSPPNIAGELRKQGWEV